jgi:hypothetical protein
MLRFKGVQNLEQKELGQMKKIDLICGQGGVLKLAGRTGIAALNGVFGMKKMNEKRQEKKNSQKSDLGYDFSLSFHLPGL